MRNCTISAKNINLQFWTLNFSSKKLKLLVSPSLLGFLSPGNGGTEEGVKTIESGEATFNVTFIAKKKEKSFCKDSHVLG